MKAKYIKVLREIQNASAVDSLPPTLKELAWAIGREHPSSVTTAIAMLERRGYISRQLNTARSIRLTESGKAYLRTQNNES